MLLLRLSTIGFGIFLALKLKLIAALLTGLQVARDAKEHVLAQFSHIDGLVALIDDVRVALLTHV